MISLTEEARKELEAYFEGKEKTPIRVYLAPGGCSGPRLALALDEPGEDDETSEDNGLTLCINNTLDTRQFQVALRRLRQFRRLPLGLNRGTVLKGPPVPILPRGGPSGGVSVAQKAIP